MHVNIISEPNFFSKDHGVHTAFLNYKDMLEKLHIKAFENSFRTCDITHIHTVGIYSLLMAIFEKNVVITAHLIPESFEDSLIGANYWFPLAQKYLRFFYNRADLILAVSPAVEKKLKEMNITKKVIMFPNSINRDIFKKDINLRKKGRKQFSISNKEIVILGVGQLQSRKGLEDFIQVAIEKPEFTFIWVGSCPFGKLTEQSTRLHTLLQKPPANFRNIQNITYKDMPLLYNSADIFFSPSHQETFGLANLEAASCGLPLILRDLSVYKSLYKYSYLKGNSIIDFIALITSLQKTAKYNEAVHFSEKIAKEFSTEKLKDLLLQEYQKLLEH